MRETHFVNEPLNIFNLYKMPKHLNRVTKTEINRKNVRVVPSFYESGRKLSMSQINIIATQARPSLKYPLFGKRIVL